MDNFFVPRADKMRTGAEKVEKSFDGSFRVNIWEECMFGRFLIEEGLASPDQLEKALTLQREMTPLVGKIALSEGYLSMGECWQILEHQADNAGLFLDIGVKMGFLSRADQEELLEIQAKSRPRIGELLVMSRVLSRESLGDAMERYQETLAERRRLAGRAASPIARTRRSPHRASTLVRHAPPAQKSAVGEK